MTSDAVLNPSQAYVWVWLPTQQKPVVAGVVTQQGSQLVFTYGRSYLARPEAISLFMPELPLQSGVILPLPCAWLQALAWMCLP
jgi:serine/threonine-protein kinase HipA